MANSDSTMAGRIQQEYAAVRAERRRDSARASTANTSFPLQGSHRSHRNNSHWLLDSLGGLISGLF